jgi:hypothetical protein
MYLCYPHLQVLPCPHDISTLGKALYFLAYKIPLPNKNPEMGLEVLLVGFNIMECQGAKFPVMLSVVLFFVWFKIFL